jgi:light-regulated signal transduction histidine kinase (bacteriophytochrome)
MVEFVIADGLVDHGDERLLRVMLQNLIGNAWKYSARQAKASIEFGLTQRDGAQAYFVQDNGVGFDMALADKLFKPFQRLHGSEDFPGTGIGLALVQRIARRHGGRAWAEGEVGKGARFYFTLQ